MKHILVILLMLSQYAVAGVLPNPVMTPGDTDTKVTTAHICTKGFTEGYWHEHKWYAKGTQPNKSRAVRNVSSKQKKITYSQYGLAGNDRIHCSRGYEVDHLISLELGGSNTLANRWPQSYCRALGEDGSQIIPSSAVDKDQLENALKTLVCSGQITLQEAQKEIATDWVSSYKKRILSQ